MRGPHPGAAAAAAAFEGPHSKDRTRVGLECSRDEDFAMIDPYETGLKSFGD